MLAEKRLGQVKLESCKPKPSPVRGVPEGTSRRMAQLPRENKIISVEVAAASSSLITVIRVVVPQS
jgi:hypothetical protein